MRAREPGVCHSAELLDLSPRHVKRVKKRYRQGSAATLPSVRRQRQQGNNDVAITLADRGAGQPQAIVAWFYVGDTDGHEFLYSKQQARELAHATQTTVVSGD